MESLPCQATLWYRHWPTTTGSTPTLRKTKSMQEWRMELATFIYTFHYRPGEKNVVPDAFTRDFCCYTHMQSTSSALTVLHDGFCHSGVTTDSHTELREIQESSLLHWGCHKGLNLLQYLCRVETKFFIDHQQERTLINVTYTQPLETLNIDFN